ncbi:MAG: hypothetical protein AAF824_09780 [Bacteroidota bacterium]
MKSPFKFLDAYDMEDKDVFFGRDLEIKDLYKKVSMSPLLLVYGLSGTGKTSLVSCGLAQNFNGPDWYPFFIRRKRNINTSLHEVLSEALQDREEEAVTAKLSFIYDRYLCPVYLIFDQFEELFILGSKEEQEEFAQTLLEVMEADIPCKIILIMREEYLGDLYQLEQTISTIYDNRLRVESMRREKVKDVLKLSFGEFDIGLEGEDEERLNEIIDNLSEEKTGIVQLPYLQVYLDMLYKEDFSRTYPDDSFDEENLKPIELTRAEIASFGNIDGVLDRFLTQQLQEIPERLRHKFPEVDTKLLENILDGFVTEDGTKRPVQTTEKEGEEDYLNLIHLAEGEGKFFPGVAPPTIPLETFSAIIHEMVNSRLIRSNEEGLELAHDTLAALVDRRRSHEQRIKKDFQKLYNILKSTNSKLDKQQIATYQQYFPMLKRDAELEKLIEESVRKVEAQEREKREAQEREIKLTKAKLKAEQESAAKQRIVLMVTAAALVVSIALGIWGQVQRNAAVTAREKTEALLVELLDEKSEKILIEVEDLEKRAKRLQQRQPNESAVKYERAINEIDVHLNKVREVDKEYHNVSLESKREALSNSLQEVRTLMRESASR